MQQTVLRKWNHPMPHKLVGIGQEGLTNGNEFSSSHFAHFPFDLLVVIRHSIVSHEHETARHVNDALASCLSDPVHVILSQLAEGGQNKILSFVRRTPPPKYEAMPALRPVGHEN